MRKRRLSKRIPRSPGRQGGTRQLRHALSLLSAALESTIDGIYVADHAGGDVIWNRRYAELFGIPEELLGLSDNRPRLDWLRNRMVDPDGWFKRVQEIVSDRGGESSDVLQLRDGRILERHSKPQLIHGKPVGRVWTFRDVTTRHRLETELRRSHERFGTVARATNDAVWDWDIATNAVWWNDQFGVLFGYRKDQVGNSLESWTARIHSDDLDRVLRGLRAAMSGGGEAWSAEYRFRRGDGSYADVFDRGYVIRDDEGIPTRMIGAMADITERKQAEAALRESEVRFRTLSGELMRVRDFERRRLARELHDTMGQNLSALAMKLAALASTSMRLTAAERDRLEECQSAAEEAASEVRTMSYLLHPPLLEEVGLTSALRWLVEGFEKRSEVRVSLNVPADLGRLDRELELTAFRTVQEALTNVHLHSGSMTASIELRRDQTRLLIEVTDAGRGMEAAEQFGNHPVGVGIMGMRERVGQLGGVLEIVSAGRGTSVRAMLPLQAGA